MCFDDIKNLVGRGDLAVLINPKKYKIIIDQSSLDNGTSLFVWFIFPNSPSGNAINPS